MPEAYDKKDFISENKKKITLGGKYKASENQNPGPGAYEKESRLTRRKSENFVIGSAARKDPFAEVINRAKQLPQGYYEQKGMAESKKTFAMGQKRKTVVNNNPGPGAYEKPENLTQRSVVNQKIGSAVRKDLFEAEKRRAAASPSGGHYEHKDFIGMNKQKMTMGSPFKQSYNANPGPGAYKNQESLTQRSQVNQKLDKTKRKDIFEDEIRKASQLPDPGTYSNKDKKFGAHAKSASIGLPVEAKYNQNPGPGAYSKQDALTTKSQVNQKIGTQPRKDIFERELKEAQSKPSIGTYEQKDFIQQNSKKVTMGAPWKHTNNSNPGPGRYTATDAMTRPKSACQKMSQEPRKDIFKEQIQQASQLPEPGQYELKSSFNNDRAASFGQPFKQEYNANPGPGHYEK